MKKITKTLLGLSVAALLASCGCAQQPSSSSSSHDTGLSSSESSKQTGPSSSVSTNPIIITSSDTTQSSSSESTQSTQSSESSQSTRTSESSQSSESSSQPASKVVTAIIGDVTITLNENAQTDKTDGRLAEYYAEDLDVVGGQSVIIKIDGVQISENIGPDAYAEDNNLEEDDLGNILVVNNAEDASLYFKVYESGYSLYLSGLEEEEETAPYSVVTDDLGSGFGLTESKTAPEGWDAQYESGKEYLSPLDYLVIKGVKDNSTFSYAQIDPECQEFFTNTDGKAYAKEAGDYTVYLKVKTVDGVVSASIWVNFVKDYNVDFTNIVMAYGEIGEQNPAVVTEKAETGTNEVKFIIPSAEAGNLVAFGIVEEGQQTLLSVVADEDEGNNLEPLGGADGLFSVKTGGTGIEVYLKAVGENKFQVWAAGYEDNRPDLYVRGTAVGDWNATKYRFAVPKQEDQVGVIENIKLEEGEFKIASKDWNNSWGWWGYQIGDDWIDVKEGGQGNLVQGEAKANFAAVADSNNIKCNVAGYYNLYMMANNFLYITEGEGPEEEEKTYTVKLGEGDPITLVKNEEADLADGQTGEYMLEEGVDLVAGTVISFSADGTAIESGIGPDKGANVDENQGVFTVKADQEGAQIYFKTWNNGYSFYVDGPEEPSSTYTITVDAAKILAWEPAASDFAISAWGANDADIISWGDAFTKGKMTQVGETTNYSIEVESKTELTKIVFRFKQGQDEKQTVDLTTTFEDTETYVITLGDGAWVDGKMPATVAKYAEEDPEQEVVYTVKIGDGDPITLVKNEEAVLAENQTGEYMLPEGVDLVANDVIVFSGDETAISTGIGPDKGANVVNTEGVFTVKADQEDAQIYFKTWSDGYSFYVDGPEEPASTYTITVDATKLLGWNPAASDFAISAWGANDVDIIGWGDAFTDGKMTKVGETNNYAIEVEAQTALKKIVFRFKQGQDEKQTVDLSADFEDGATYVITFDDSSWTDNKMSATVAKQAAE